VPDAGYHLGDLQPCRVRLWLKVTASAILRWYGSDFGEGPEAVLRALQPYLVTWNPLLFR
jgi:hypothetical protein